ncbi:MAG: glycosyl hydrolase [Saprospiraceae bacterium]
MAFTRSILLALVLGISLWALPVEAQKKKTIGTPQEEQYYLEKIGINGLRFRSVGPAITSGRISDFAIHPQKAGTYYIATSSGGVWKTDNAGTTFQPIFDQESSYSIGCISIDPNNFNIIWVGSGENNNQRSVGYGDGVYKSEDGGSTWQHMGLKNSEHIARIIVDPRNSNVVYVAVIGPLWSSGGDRGVYKTTDGGKTWQAVLTIDEHTGVTDLIMDPRDPDVLYAAAFQRRRHVFTYVGGGPGSGIYKTTDGGASWQKANKGLPTVEKGRIGLAISPADPEVLYALVEAQDGKGGFYRSTNRGASWEKRSGHTTSGNYYVEIVPHPTDPDIIFSMDTWLQWSTDGGKSFSMVNEQYKHVDNHCMWIDPENTDHYLVGCDGGIYESWDAAKTWDFKANLPVTQFYKVALDNSQPFYYIYGGTQDNFSLGGPSRTRSRNGIANSDWFVTNGGDGFESQVEPDNPNVVYAQAQYGSLVRFDRASGEAMGIQPQPRADEDAYRWNWDAPLAVSSHEPTRIYFAANKLFRSDDRGNTWNVISDDLTRQIDRNTLKVMGRVQSIDAVAKNGSTSPYGTIVAFSESPINSQLLWVGTDDGLIQMTDNGGSSWTKIDANTLPGAPERTYVNAVLASQHNENVVYAVLNHHKYGDFKPYVYKSTDKGASWQSITANLPERGSAYSIAEDFVDPDLLFVGTEFSCFFSNDGGEHWKKLNAGLPTIAVRDIAIQQRENDLVLATFGRGFYVLDNYAPLRQLSKEDLESDAQLFPIKDGLVFIESVPLGLRGNGFQGHRRYQAENPSVGATFSYFIKEGHESLKEKRQKKEKELIEAGKDVTYPTYEELLAEEREEDPYLEFTIRDIDGNIIRKLKTGLNKGVQRIVWDGRYPNLDPISLRSSGFDNPFANEDIGMLAAPGAYTVSLSRSINGQLEEIIAPQPFRLKALGGETLPAADRDALAAFQRQTHELQRELSGAGQLMNDINNRLRHIEKAIFATPSPSPDLVSDYRAIENKMYELRKDLYGDRLRNELDLAQKASLVSRLSSVVYDMWSSTSAPTTTQREGLRLAKATFGPVLTRIRNVREQDLKALEDKLEKAGAPYTPGRDVRRNGGR